MLNKLAEKLPFNWALLSNPINWVTIWVMIAIGLVGLRLITASATQQKEDE